MLPEWNQVRFAAQVISLGLAVAAFGQWAVDMDYVVNGGLAIVAAGLLLLSFGVVRPALRWFWGGVVLSVEQEGEHAYLVIENRGPAATFWAGLLVAGSVVGIPEHEVFARWDHTEDVRAQIPSRGSHRLRLGRLEMNRAVGQWFIPYTSDNQGKEGHARLSWVFYGPDGYQGTDRRSVVLVAVTLFSEPEFRGCPIQKLVLFRGSEAIPLELTRQGGLRWTTASGQAPPS